MIGLLLCGLTALGLVAIGLGALVAPGFSAGQYGIVVEDARAHAYLRAMGARDLVLGIVLGLVLGLGSRGLLAASVAACALVALADFALVRSDASARPGGAPPRALAVHAAGGVGLLVASVLVALGI